MFGISYQSRLLILQHCPPSKEPLTILTPLSYKATNIYFADVTVVFIRFYYFICVFIHTLSFCISVYIWKCK